MLFALAREGILLQITGSVALGVTVYLINSACLVFFAVAYIWQSAQKGKSSYSSYEALKLYASAQTKSGLAKNGTPSIECIANELELAMASRGEQIVTSIGDISTIQIGSEALLFTQEQPKLIVKVKVLAIEGKALRVFIV